MNIVYSCTQSKPSLIPLQLIRMSYILYLFSSEVFLSLNFPLISAARFSFGGADFQACFCFFNLEDISRQLPRISEGLL
jgi:hypothetical protein